MTDTKPTTDEHSCSYHCDRPECIKAQRDSMREELKRIQSAEIPVEPKVYNQQFFCNDGTIESHEAVLKHDYDALKAYAQAIHNEALELAAKECDSRELYEGMGVANTCAEAIRKLKV